MAADLRTMSVIEAREMAVRAHGDQRDRDGSFHIAHVARVAEAVPRSDSHHRVAWLHDVLEDSDVDIEHLRERLSEAEVDAVLLLTHDVNEERYEDYIERLVCAPGEAGALARAVKEADMLDNLRRCALARDPAVGQYGQALAKLWSGDGGM
jgi:(p)ppGpp synthase/HD superfamily hydrolase